MDRLTGATTPSVPAQRHPRGDTPQSALPSATRPAESAAPTAAGSGCEQALVSPEDLEVVLKSGSVTLDQLIAARRATQPCFNPSPTSRRRALRLLPALE